jgi:hypothetical protein
MSADLGHCRVPAGASADLLRNVRGMAIALVVASEPVPHALEPPRVAEPFPSHTEVVVATREPWLETRTTLSFCGEILNSGALLLRTPRGVAQFWGVAGSLPEALSLENGLGVLPPGPH